MKFKEFIYPFILFLIGIVLTVGGAFFKLFHWEFGLINGSNLLLLAAILNLIGIGLLIVKLITFYRIERNTN